MKGAIITLLGAIVLLLSFGYLAKPQQVMNGVLGRLYHLILLGLLKADLAFGHFGERLGMIRSRLFKGYQYNAASAVRLREKEQHLSEYRQQMRESANGYRRQKNYKRKIME